MNGLFWIIVCVLILDFMIRSYATLLNLRSLRSRVPEELDDIYEAEGYRQSQEYIRVQSRFGLTISAVKLIGSLVFWFVGGFNYVDQAVRLIGWNEITNGILYFGIFPVEKYLILSLIHI